MKKIIEVLLLCCALPGWAQPTGHSKIYLVITDQGDTLHFEYGFRTHEQGWKTSLTYKTYELRDVSENQTGFEWYPMAGYVHKTLMTDDHHIQIVNHTKDTMNIEIFNAYNVYFLHIPFQKGHYRLYVNDGKLHQWNYNTLPYKRVNTEQYVYDITPAYWGVFQVDNRKGEVDYFIADQFAKQQLLVKPIIPEDDPNFRNPRRIQNLQKEVADYNFDGQQDYREQKWNDNTLWNYFIYHGAATGFVLDTVLSSMDACSFDFDKQSFVGLKTSRIDSLTTQWENYEYVHGVIALVRVMVCVQAFRYSEKMDCTVRALENGVWVDKEPILGAE